MIDWVVFALQRELDEDIAMNSTEVFMRNFSHSSLNPHKKFYDHILNGGKVWRDDKLNNVQEWIDINTLGGDATKIRKYGYNDLSIKD